MIQIYNNKGVKHFYKILINIALKTGQSVEKPKKYN